jgi:sterol desaturase/sphingolipid hydroxylase (fatty acid hydroxylase superfamily)
MPWAIINLAIFFLAFGFLAKLAACNPQQPKFVSHEMADDALYWLINVLFYGGLSTLILKAGFFLADPRHASALLAKVTAGYGPVSHLPLVVQAVLVIVAMDVIQYWVHRLLHGRALWPFHAIHHSARNVTWTTTYRIHPLNFLVYAAGATAVVKLAGFSPATFLVIAPFNTLMGFIAHANLNWTYGPFRYVLASPVFHRWHHTRDPRVHDKNFAPTFPVLDLVFGTFYMPKGALPADYGADGAPDHFLGQLIYPFAVYAERAGLGRRRPGRATA